MRKRERNAEREVRERKVRIDFEINLVTHERETCQRCSEQYHGAYVVYCTYTNVERSSEKYEFRNSIFFKFMFDKCRQIRCKVSCTLSLYSPQVLHQSFQTSCTYVVILNLIKRFPITQEMQTFYLDPFRISKAYYVWRLRLLVSHKLRIRVISNSSPVRRDRRRRVELYKYNRFFRQS